MVVVLEGVGEQGQTGELGRIGTAGSEEAACEGELRDREGIAEIGRFAEADDLVAVEEITFDVDGRGAVVADRVAVLDIVRQRRDGIRRDGSRGNAGAAIGLAGQSGHGADEHRLSGTEGMAGEIHLAGPDRVDDAAGELDRLKMRRRHLSPVDLDIRQDLGDDEFRVVLEPGEVGSLERDDDLARRRPQRGAEEAGRVVAELERLAVHEDLGQAGRKGGVPPIGVIRRVQEVGRGRRRHGRDSELQPASRTWAVATLRHMFPVENKLACWDPIRTIPESAVTDLRQGSPNHRFDSTMRPDPRCRRMAAPIRDGASGSQHRPRILDGLAAHVGARIVAALELRRAPFDPLAEYVQTSGGAFLQVQDDRVQHEVQGVHPRRQIGNDCVLFIRHGRLLPA
ncbi:MAG: hypothetical protein PGN34_16165 [Methylobacterium frigidaeris]